MSTISLPDTFAPDKNSLELDFSPPKNLKRKKSRKLRRKKGKKTIFFSKLPLTLKKQFLYMMTKNGVAFSEEGKFMEAVIELRDTEEGKTPTKGGKSAKKVKPRYMDCLKKGKAGCFHKKCKLQDWELRNLRKEKAKARLRRKKVLEKNQVKSSQKNHQPKFFFDKKNLAWKTNMTEEELRAHLRHIPYNKIDMGKLNLGKVNPADLQAAKNNFARKVEQLINENEVYDRRYYYGNIANRLSYTKCEKNSKVSSESLFVEYKEIEQDKENLISPNTRQKRRQWAMKKSVSRSRKSPFSSVVNSPKCMRLNRRRSSYTPSINLQNFDFAPIDNRIEARKHKSSQKLREIGVLKDLNSYNVQRRLSSNFEENKTSLGYGTTDQMIDQYYGKIEEINRELRDNLNNQKKEKISSGDVSVASDVAKPPSKSKRKLHTLKENESKLSKMFDPSYIEVKEMNKNIKRPKKPKNNFSLVEKRPKRRTKSRKRVALSTKELLKKSDKSNEKLFKTEKISRKSKKSILKNKYINSQIEEEQEDDDYNLINKSEENGSEDDHPVYNLSQNFDTKEKIYNLTNPNMDSLVPENFKTKNYRKDKHIEMKSTKQKKRIAFEEDFESVEKGYITDNLEGPDKISFINISKHSSRKEKKVPGKRVNKGILDAGQYYRISRDMPLLTSDSDPEDQIYNETLESSRSPRKSVSPEMLLQSSRLSENILENENLRKKRTLEEELARMYSRNISPSDKEVHHYDDPNIKISNLTQTGRTQNEKLKKMQTPKSMKARKRRFRIPTNLQNRMKRRKSRSKSGKKQFRRTTPRRLYRFKNQIEEEEKVQVKVGLDMLHTKELLSYYKDVLNKSKKDFVVHHRQQNLMKKYEYM